MVQCLQCVQLSAEGPGGVLYFQVVSLSVVIRIQGRLPSGRPGQGSLLLLPCESWVCSKTVATWTWCVSPASVHVTRECVGCICVPHGP